MRVIKISKFIAEEESVEWLIDGLVPNVGWTLFYAPAGTGKTTFAVQMCLALQEGKPFLNHTTRQTTIFYIQADSLGLEWKAMLRRIAPHGSDGFTVVDVPDRCLGNGEYTTRLQKYVELYNPGYVVFDSLYKLTAWPINNDNGIQLAIGMMLQIVNGRPWMLIHHPPHESSRPAGHNSLAASASYVWALLRTQLKVEKGRLVKDEKILLKRDEQGLWYARVQDDPGEGNGILTYTVL